MEQQRAFRVCGDLAASPAGRYVISTRPLDAGEAVLEPMEALVAAPHTAFRKRVCGSCLQVCTSTAYTVHCIHCTQVFYCSIHCLDLDHTSHQHVCNVIRPPSRIKKLGKHLIPYYQMLIKYHVLLTPVQIAQVDSLQSHHLLVKSIDPDTYQQWKRIAKAVLQVLHLDHDQINKSIQFISKVECNGFGPALHKNKQMYVALYNKASMFNHSCRPTCYCHIEYGKLSIICKEPCRQDQELTISYIDTCLKQSARSKDLWLTYWFHCNCERCMREKST